MAAYINSDYVDAFFGFGVRSKLFTDSNGDYSEAMFTLHVEAASALVASYAKGSGYAGAIAVESDGTASDDMIKSATLGALMRSAYGRPDKRLPEPEGLDRHTCMLSLEGLRTGDAPIPTADPDSAHAVGGFSFTESDPDADNSRPRRTSRVEMDGY